MHLDLVAALLEVLRYEINDGRTLVTSKGNTQQETHQ
jgi:hypothetical protein